MQTIKTLSFNTGRLYTEHGQRIGAARLADGTVAFDDVDRGLYYVTTGPCELSQAAIMRAYDYNQTEGRRYGNDALTDEIKNAIRAAAYAARSLKAEPEPEPEQTALALPYATMKSTGERVQILGPYKKGFLVFVDGWAHDVEVSANDLLLDAPAAPVLTDAEPVQTEMEFDDGVEEHDYVVTGCHDEDNTEPAPAAPQAPETRSPIEWLRLTRDVANPRRDRRMKYCWQSVDTFKAGTIFEVWPDSDGGRSVWFGTMGLGDLKLEAALIDAAEPAIGQDFEEIKKIAGHGYALGSNVIDYALAQGWLTQDQILQALAAGATE
jgi:hypothetical protein